MRVGVISKIYEELVGQWIILCVLKEDFERSERPFP